MRLAIAEDSGLFRSSLALLLEASGAQAVVLTQELIARVYAARVTVSTDPGGHPVVTPVRQPPPER